MWVREALEAFPPGPMKGAGLRVRVTLEDLGALGPENTQGKDFGARERAELYGPGPAEGDLTGDLAGLSEGERAEWGRLRGHWEAWRRGQEARWREGLRAKEAQLTRALEEQA